MKLKAAFETDVFINDEGYCVIEQVRGDDAVWLTAEQAKAVIAELEKLLTRQSWQSPISKER